MESFHGETPRLATILLLELAQELFQGCCVKPKSKGEMSELPDAARRGPKSESARRVFDVDRQCATPVIIVVHRVVYAVVALNPRLITGLPR